MLVPGVFAVHTNLRIFRGACALAVVTAGVSITMMVRGETGNPLVEASFFLFFAFITVSIFVEVMRTRDVMADTGDLVPEDKLIHGDSCLSSITCFKKMG